MLLRRSQFVRIIWIVIHQFAMSYGSVVIIPAIGYTLSFT
jgi:hypothetical protein